MKMVVMFDLVSTFLLPSGFVYLYNIMVEAFLRDEPLSPLQIVAFACVGVMTLPFVFRAQWDYFLWFFFFLIGGIPVFTFACRCTHSGTWMIFHGGRRGKLSPRRSLNPGKGNQNRPSRSNSQTGSSVEKIKLPALRTDLLLLLAQPWLNSELATSSCFALTVNIKHGEWRRSQSILTVNTIVGVNPSIANVDVKATNNIIRA
jgi:hypothetical protein